jgi:LytR cell envelope-related transcriptional attenuator
VSYIVESGASTSRRTRRRRALITLAVVAAMLFGSFWYAYSYYRTANEPKAASTPACTTTTDTKAPKPSAITVNVYNSTDRNGLAASTAAAVRKRGFTVSTVANDPLQKKIAGTAEVRHGKTSAAAAKTVAALVKGAKIVRDSRTDASVDLVLGEKFVTLAPAPTAPPKSPGTPPPAKAPAAKTPAPKTPAPKTPAAKTTAPPSGKTPATTPAC